MYKTRGNNVRQGCDRLRRQGVSEHIQLLVRQGECITYRIRHRSTFSEIQWFTFTLNF